LVPIGGKLIGSGRLVCGAGLASRISSASLATCLGSVKTELEGAEGPLALGLPTVIVERNYHARSIAVGEPLVAPFECGEDRLEIHMFLAPEADRQAGKPAHALIDFD
jgi:hypothetical protein